MAANQWLSVNARRIESIRKFLVESSFQDSDIKGQIKEILMLLDHSLGEVGRLQREVNALRSENEALKTKKV